MESESEHQKQRYLDIGLVKQQEAENCGNSSIVHAVLTCTSFLDGALKRCDFSDAECREYADLLLQEVDVALKFARIAQAGQGFDRNEFFKELDPCTAARRKKYKELKSSGKYVYIVGTDDVFVV